ncbi:hypothetical protein DL768_006168 [Monosporascus sp. mg162]|nr:hypothetical protein DL768_006168 [Monosporascus sp. mg162]
MMILSCHTERFTIESSQGQERSARKAARVNANAYTARLAATGDPALASYGVTLSHASRVIFSALEFGHGGKEPDELEAAAHLFKYAALELYSRCRTTILSVKTKPLRMSPASAKRVRVGVARVGFQWSGGTFGNADGLSWRP